MVKYFCRSCSYRFTTKGDRIPKDCPACGTKGDVVRDYDADTLLRSVIEEDI